MYYNYKTNIYRRSISKTQTIDNDNTMKPLMFNFPSEEHNNHIFKIKQRTKEVQWELHFKEYGKGVSMYKTKELVNMVLMGVPESLRSNLWLTFSGMISYY